MSPRFDRDRTKSFARFIWQRFVADNCFETAGALAYITLVSLVPLLVATFAIFSAFPAFAGARDQLLGFVFNNFVPAAGEKLQTALQGFADNAKSLTGISILVMLFSALAMMVSIEDCFNRVWRVHHARSWGSRLLLYWAALTLGPILVVVGVGAASFVTALPLLHGQGGGMDSSGASPYLIAVIPFVVTFVTLWLMYAAIPNRPVVLRDAAIGAVLGAVVFEVARWGFALFVAHAKSYQEIYGALAVLPIFLLWIYLSWVIVILCASIAASINAYEYRKATDTLPEGAEFLGLLVVVKHFVQSHREGISVDPAWVRAAEPYLSSSQVTCYFDDLQHADLIQRGESGGWLLSRSLDNTDLLRVYMHSSYRLPLEPRKEIESLSLQLPPNLVDLLDAMASTLDTALGTPLGKIYPPEAPTPEAGKSGETGQAEETASTTQITDEGDPEPEPDSPAPPSPR